MRVENTELCGVRRIVPEVFEDHRGRYVEIFDTAAYAEVCGDLDFVQDDVSISHERVLRGIHGDFETNQAGHGRGRLRLRAAGRQPAGVADLPALAGLPADGREPRTAPRPARVGNSVLSLRGELVYLYKQTTHFVPGRQFIRQRSKPRSGVPFLPQASRRGRAGARGRVSEPGRIARAA